MRTSDGGCSICVLQIYVKILNIYYGNMPKAIFNTSVYFKNAYEDAWITDPVAREMILDVDKSTVLDSAVIDSPVMGRFFPRLSAV